MYGLIGYPLSHSFSKKYFANKFLQENIAGCRYENFELRSISELPSLIQQTHGLLGFNITIPYKEQVIPFLDHQHEVVAKTGACNCVRLHEGKLFGYNTDVAGFEQSLQEKLLPVHRKALILGTGGASKAVAYVLKQLGIGFLYVSRTHSGSQYVKYGEVSDSMLHEHTLIINTTPTGMYPAVLEVPPLHYEIMGPDHYLFDLVYNPDKTVFLQKGEQQGAATKNGYDMLVIQAEESWKIWTGSPPLTDQS